MFTSIVVGTDGTATAAEAVRRAGGLARLCGAKLHVVTAYRPITEMVFNPEAIPIDIGNMLDPQKDAVGVCEQAARNVAGDGLEIDIHACPGNPADALIDVAEREKADLI